MAVWHVDATVRLKTATFHFDKNMWEVEAYLNFKGPSSNESIVDNEVKHSWFAYGTEFDALEKILIDKVGSDLCGPQLTLAALQKEY